MPLKRFPLKKVPFHRAPFILKPFQREPLNVLPFKRLPLKNVPFKAIPLKTGPLMVVVTDDSTIAADCNSGVWLLESSEAVAKLEPEIARRAKSVIADFMMHLIKG